MSLFSWLSGPSGTTKPASDEAGADTMRPPPCVQVRTSPVVQMKRKPPSRAAEELYVAILRVDDALRVLSSSFKFKVLSPTSGATPFW
jgi:hypothetical protein